MDIRKVKKLIELLDESGIAEIEITEGEEAVRISRYATGAPVAPAPAPAPVVAAPGKIAPPLQCDSPAGHRAVAARARAEFRANGVLAGLTSEDAYVEDACRCAC